MTVAKAKEAGAAARPTDPGGGGEVVLQPIVLTPEQRAHKGNRAVARLADLVDAIIAHGRQRIFPKKMPGTWVLAQIALNLAATAAVTETGAAQRSTVAQRNESEKIAKKLLQRMTQLVTSAYDEDSAEIVDFYPPTTGTRTLAGRLLAMASGLDKHGLPDVPPDISSAILVATAHSVAVNTGQRANAGTAHDVASGAKAVTFVRASKIYAKLVKALRGYYGEDSEKLALFGIKPIVRRGPARGRKLTEEEKAARRLVREKKKALEDAATKTRKTKKNAAKAAEDEEKLKKAQEELAAAQKALQDAQAAAEAQASADGQPPPEPASGAETPKS